MVSSSFFNPIHAGRLGWIGGLAILVFAVGSVWGEEEREWSGPGCVLLKNGNVLTATDIVPQGKYLAMRLDETGEIRLPNREVVAIGRDPLELYHYQVSKTTRWGAGEHWHLAKWCLLNGLVEQSRVHYEQLRQISGDHERFKQLDSELKQALLQDPVMKAALKTAFPAAAVSAASHTESTSSDQELIRDDSNRLSESQSMEKRNAPTLMRDVDRMAQDYFRQQIQPFLAMRCGQAGCHGAFGKSEFHVAKSGVVRGLPASEASIESALRFLDDSDIERTKLWLKATSLHGTQTGPSLSQTIAKERDMLNRLRHWHQMVLRSNEVAKQEMPSSPMIRAADLSQPRAKEVTPPVARRLEHSKPADLGDDLLTLEREIARLEAIEKGKRTSNRHDPEEFNRRFGGK